MLWVLGEVILMSTHDIGFYKEISKNVRAFLLFQYFGTDIYMYVRIVKSTKKSFNYFHCARIFNYPD